MRLAAVLHFLLGVNVEPDQQRVNAARASWRHALHINRNEATRAIATARQARMVSDQALATMNETIRAQEEGSGAVLLKRLKELD